MDAYSSPGSDTQKRAREAETYVPTAYARKKLVYQNANNEVTALDISFFEVSDAPANEATQPTTSNMDAQQPESAPDMTDAQRLAADTALDVMMDEMFQQEIADDNACHTSQPSSMPPPRSCSTQQNTPRSYHPSPLTPPPGSPGIGDEHLIQDPDSSSDDSGSDSDSDSSSDSSDSDDDGNYTYKTSDSLKYAGMCSTVRVSDKSKSKKGKYFYKHWLTPPVRTVTDTQQKASIRALLADPSTPEWITRAVPLAAANGNPWMESCKYHAEYFGGKQRSHSLVFHSPQKPEIRGYRPQISDERRRLDNPGFYQTTVRELRVNPLYIEVYHETHPQRTPENEQTPENENKATSIAL